MTDANPPPYRHVRSLYRGLNVLQELNRLGRARPSELAHATGLDRTTIYRLLATLVEFGVVATTPSSDEYVLTKRVRSLSDGFTERDRTTRIVSTHLGTLFQKVLWPTDFATFEAGEMIIRETTHRFSPYSVHRAMVGRPRPLLTSALGRAAFAGASEEARADMLAILRGSNIAAVVPVEEMDAHIERLLNDYARRGYSWSFPVHESQTCAIAISVNTGTEVASAINLLFFRSAMSVDAAADRYLHHLKECVAQVEASLLEEVGELASGPL